MDEIQRAASEAAARAGDNIAIVIAQQAQKDANAALAQIMGHERACDEREDARVKREDRREADLKEAMAQTKAAVAEVKNSISRLYDLRWRAACTLIALLIGIIAYFIQRYGVVGQ